MFISFAWPKETEPKKRPPESLAALCAVPCALRYFARSRNSLRSDSAHSIAKFLRCSARDDGKVGQNHKSKTLVFRHSGVGRNPEVLKTFWMPDQGGHDGGRWSVALVLNLTFAPSMQPSIAAFIGLSKNLFERSEFIFAPMKARSAGKSHSDQIVGWPFFWLLFFGHSKKSDSQPSDKNKEIICAC